MSYEAIRSREVTLRKKFRCNWCGEMMQAGERAQSRAYKWDGDFCSDKTHPECYTAMGVFYSIPDNHNESFDPCEFKRGSIEPR